MSEKVIYKECCVIGCGISGIAVARWLKKYNFDFVVLEKSEDIAGLWRYKENDYGVMSFTHINVSKYNYSFSDYQFPKESVEFMHHSHIYEYAKSYMKMHNLYDYTKFNHQVILLEELNKSDVLYSENLKFQNMDNYERLWKLTVKVENREIVYISPYVAVATGHHFAPKHVKFPGQETFTGEIIHSVKYKNAKFNKMAGKKVLLVGIGNSSVDIADNLVTQGEFQNVTISSKSGSWIFPNYINGYTTDLYPSRFMLSLPWQYTTIIYESLIKFICGDPKKYNLNPNSRALQYHPTVSPSLLHHIQRKKVTIQPNIKEISRNEVTFSNGIKENFDSIVMCTGYKIGMDFLSHDLKKEIFDPQNDAFLNLYKLVFLPKYESNIAFIGFVQPHTGGILPISEIQARWFVYLMLRKTKLPNQQKMREEINNFKKNVENRFYKSSRHTLQVDPLLYNDEISSFFGAKPNLIKNPALAWRIMFTSCGSAQWRINGPDALPEAVEIVKSVPIPPMNTFTAGLCFFAAIFFILVLYLFPIFVPVLAFILFIINYLRNL